MGKTTPDARTAFAAFAIPVPAFLQVFEDTPQRRNRPRPLYLQEARHVIPTPTARFSEPQLHVRQHRPPVGRPLFQPELVGVPLAQPQAVQPDIPILRAVLALEGTFELASVLSLEASMLDVSVGHERHLPFGRAWYLPGQRSGRFAGGPKKRLRR